uniref:Thioredoxin domain-containing protein n=1 Tax=Ditylum brightwellii TaxID=49249 RepID=A0A7S1YR55_9STRA|mmetsp:Transcript_14828/g.22087  ORF Transcript_14828/g.22087 Transcript_14828/m.22087 type:complete len:135 (+) Transcript_14828:442-846(+)
MKRFLDEQMPSFIETIRGTKDLTTFTEKAERNGALPRVLLFTSKAKTSSLTKFISTEFRRRILLAEVYPTKTNKEIMDKFGITDLPAMVVIRKSEQEGEEGMDEVIRYEGDGYTKNKLLTFFVCTCSQRTLLSS